MSLQNLSRKVICSSCGSSIIIDNRCVDCGSDVDLHIKKKMEEKEKHCYNCDFLEEIYAQKRNDDGLFDRVLDDVVCRCPDKDDFVKGPCEHFKVVEGMEKVVRDGNYVAIIAKVEIVHNPKYYNFSLWERIKKRIRKLIVKVGRKK